MDLKQVFVTRVSDDGTRVWVSELDTDSEHEATVLSPIPTDITDGRRMSGHPTAQTNITTADMALCGVVGARWYILGYYNMPLPSGERVSIVKDKENLAPFKGGFMFKISKLGQIIYRKSNMVTTWLGSWANQEMKGISPLDDTRDETITTKFANIIEEAWGGMTSWTRTKTDERMIDYPTSYVSVKRKSYEMPGVEDHNLAYDERNDSIDDTVSEPNQVPAENAGDMNYVDKVIERAGKIRDDNHVYERETRSSGLRDKEKTVFTMTQEGLSDTGVSKLASTENNIKYTQTIERRGADMDGTGVIMDNNYYQNDEEGVAVDVMSERFGNATDALYRKEVSTTGDTTHSDIEVIGLDGNYTRTFTDTEDATITVTKDITGYTIVIAGDKNITVSAPYTGDYKISADTTITLDAPKIEVGGTEKMMLGDTFMAYFNTHIHATGVGPSAPPTAPMTAAQLSTKHTNG